jgi:hypothetical protein
VVRSQIPRSAGGAHLPATGAPVATGPVVAGLVAAGVMASVLRRASTR